jgi:hypothetical protein
MTAEELREQDIADLRALLLKKEGARFFTRLLSLCGVFRISYVPGDTHTTAFNEGQRNIGNILLTDLAGIENYNVYLEQGTRERQLGIEDEEEYDGRYTGIRQ